MNKSVRNYLLGAIASYLVVMLVVIALADKSDQTHAEEIAIATTTSTIAPRTLPVPAFEETEATLKIPNPCESISEEKASSIVPSYMRQGPVIQNAVAPSKKCEWMTDGEETPRLGISIILSTTFFDESEADKLSDLTVGDKSFSVDGYVTGFGGTICGKTAIVKKGEFSFAVALCNKNDKAPTDEELESLAKGVEASLSQA